MKVDEIGALEQPLLEVKNLKQYFQIKGEGLFEKNKEVKAVDDISFHINQGETLGIVGESGCGKSTTGRAILRLNKVTSGEINFQGEDILKVSKKEMRKLRKKIQVIFQDPYASLNPKQTVGDILYEALAIQDVVPKKQRKDRITELLAEVGLPADAADRYPHEFSGGQRQRIGISRALAVDPEIIVCDEAVSALDVSVQAQVLNLLKRLQDEFNLTYLFISHDLGVVRHISDRVIVMYLGKIVEIATKDQLFEKPQHPYTQALLSSIPEIGKKKKDRIILKGDVPSPLNPPTGCRFHTRCPLAMDICKQKEPKLLETEFGHKVACHLVHP